MSDSEVKSDDHESPMYRVGYAIDPKKQQTFIQPSLIEYVNQRGIQLIRIDPDRPLIQQGPFHCLLHKLYDQDWKNQLFQFSSSYPDSVIVDPPPSIEKLRNRVSMLEEVTHLTIPGLEQDSNPAIAIAVPNQVVVQELTDFTASNSAMKFPLIAKPCLVDGSEKSHEMSLVFNEKGLENLSCPTVLQEFVNHGGVVFKVYVAGEHVTCVRRRSLPDLSQEKLQNLGLELELGGGSIRFSQISSLAQPEEGDDKKGEMPPWSVVKGLASGLREALGLNLFNVDVIRDANDRNRYLVVDINYFPGYAKIPSYEPMITDFLWDVLHLKN